MLREGAGQGGNFPIRVGLGAVGVYINWKTIHKCQSSSGEKIIFISWRRRLAAWLVHLFTASGAVLGLLMLSAVHRQRFLLVFWLMAGTIIIDSVDGVLARRAKTSIAASRVDGALLDNLVDYLTYVTVPAFFILESNLLPEGWRFVGAGLIVVASAYQFSQSDAKTEDHFFKGFPSYWNITVFYMFLWQTSPWVNMLVIAILITLVFIPIKYVYPSRPDKLSRNPLVRAAVVFATILWGASSIALLWIYPETNLLLMTLSASYIVLYMLVSLCSTFGCARFLSKGREL